MNANQTSPAPEEYVYVGDLALLNRLIHRMGAAEWVALDTEADSLHNYFEKVCLMQISFDGEHYIVDPLSGVDLSDLLQALAQKPLILHGGDYDLRMLRTSLDFRPRTEVFDTMIAAQLLGFEQIGLAALIERFFGTSITKEGQKSDWSRRPLSKEQLDYAINDTRYLEPLAERLREELRARGRLNWHLESCRAMVDSSARDKTRDPDQAWRIKGSGRLSRPQLAYLRELWHWRDQQARRANLPSFKVLGNDQMLELVQWVASHTGASLQQGPKLPRNLTGARLHALEDAVARVARLLPGHWPELVRGQRGDILSSEMKTLIDALRGECARIANELQLASSVLAPRAALEAIARKRPRTVGEIMSTGGLLSWQAELVKPAVVKCFGLEDETSETETKL
jgi:ribonuclease D